MKAYPSIQYWNKGTFGEAVYVYEKLDGTQIRAEWSKKRGFYKFGSRGQMIDQNHEQWGEAVRIFLETYSDSLPAIFKNKYREVENFVCFAEYYGYNSFAGNHEVADRKHVTLFDVSAYKRGFVAPDEFRKNFTFDIPTARFLGRFTYNKELILQIQNLTYAIDPVTVPIQATFEGVVCKGIRKTKGQEQVWMTKIKSNDWLKKVHAQYGLEFLKKELNNDPELY